MFLQWTIYGFTNIIAPRSEFPQKGVKYYKKTLVKKSASIGANSTIICGNTIGKYSLIGAGSVITKDVPDFAIIVGSPGKKIGWIDEQGNKLVFLMKMAKVSAIGFL